MLLSLIASKSIKHAIGYAYKVAVLALEALKAIQTSDHLSDDHRARLGAVLRALVSIRDFLAKMVILFGVDLAATGLSSLAAMGNSLDAATDKLNRLTGDL